MACASEAGQAACFGDNGVPALSHDDSVWAKGDGTWIVPVPHESITAA